MQNKKFRLRNNLILNILFSFSSVTLALFGFLAVLPPASEPEASAIIDGEQFALTVTNSEAINLEINPTDSGSIAVAKDTIVANTNSPAGYKLYVSTDSTTSNDIHLNGRESNDTADKKLVATTGTNELPTQLENNSWGFAIAGAGNFDTTYNAENPSMSAKFAAVPQKDAEQLIHDHSGRAIDDQTEIYFAAKANTSIASGNYQTTILYTTLSEATDQDTTEINVEDGVLPANYTNKTVTLKTSIMLSRTPTLKVAVSNIEANNIQILNEKPLELSFTAPENLETGDHDLELTIINLAKSYTKPNALKVKPALETMQQMTPELCDSLPLEEQKQLIDERDGKTYWVAKLKDGNCWMTQNLDYDLSVAENQTLTPETSNVTTIRTVVPDNLWGIDEYIDGGDYYYIDGITQANLSLIQANDINHHYAIGDYYTWTMVTAGLGDFGDFEHAGQDINESICPAGWRLPTIESELASPIAGMRSGISEENLDDMANYSFDNLLKQYGYVNFDQQTVLDYELRSSPLFFIRHNHFKDGDVKTKTTYYWSSRRNHGDMDTGGYYFYNDGTVYKDSFNSIGYHLVNASVRCVAQGNNTFTVIYNVNGGTGSVSPQTETTIDPEKTFTIPEANLEKEGFAFIGWSEDQSATFATYKTNDEITLNIHKPEKTLYAIYMPVMQEISLWKDTLELEQQIQVKDARDGKIYWVAKLKDGNIWMTQNLDYDLSVQANQTSTPATSNVTENRTVVPANTDLATFSTDNNSIYYLDGGDVYYANGTTKTEGYSTLPADDTNRHYAQGDYYSWRAATAGQGTTSITNTDVNESICPAGWRLPTSNSADANYSFGNLVKQYGYTGTNGSASDATLLASPLFFARGGFVRSGSLCEQGSGGHYWSSRAYSNSLSAYFLDFYSSLVNPSVASNRRGGFSVRCVAL